MFLNSSEEQVNYKKKNQQPGYLAKACVQFPNVFESIRHPASFFQMR